MLYIILYLYIIQVGEVAVNILWWSFRDENAAIKLYR